MSDFDKPGPIGWRGRHDTGEYRKATEALAAILAWAGNVGLSDSGAQTLWLGLAAADLAGRPLTLRDLRQSGGTSRYLLDRSLRRALRNGLVRRAISPRDARQTVLTLTSKGRAYLVSIFDALLEELAERDRLG